ncbi:two-component system, NtrC family, sensor kinase [Gammaproteobacteria bacterium]
MIIMSVPLLLFMRSMIDTPRLVPRLDRLIKGFIVAYVVLSVLLALAYDQVVRLMIVFYAITMLLILVTSMICAIKRQRSAYYFVLAFTAVCLLSFLTVLRGLGVLPLSFMTSSGVFIGSTMEMLLLAFALADRIEVIRREKAKAQADALEAQLILVENLKTSEQILEEGVRSRTTALLESNAALSEANQELKIAYSLAETSRQQAESARQEATQALDELRMTQAQMIQSEKMASLGQLVANVAHEINTPIGAVKSSGKNIADSLDQALENMSKLFQKVDVDSQDRFLALIHHANTSRVMLSTREERSLTREIARQLDEAGIVGAREKAGILIELGAQSALAETMYLLRHPECRLILDTAYSVATIINNTTNINNAVDRVSKIIFALKAFSRINKSGEKIVASLQEGIETVLTIYQNQIKLGTELVCEFEEVPPLLCLPDELNQVWTNLIHNALQAMNNKGRLTIGLRRIGNDAVVSVTDTGCGIPDEIRGKIFDAFFTTKRAGEGSGLGLDIVKKIVDKHQGRIEVESEVGVGSRFSVYLPYEA